MQFASKIVSVIFVIFIGLLISSCGSMPGSDQLNLSVTVTPTIYFENPIANPTIVGESSNTLTTPVPTSGSGLPVVKVCLTDSELINSFGFQKGEVVRTDATWDICKWNRQTTSSLVEFTLPEGWGLTYTDENGNVWVTVGVGQKVVARGFTLRQPGNQFLTDNYNYFQKEWEYGLAPERGEFKYFHCPDKDFYPLISDKMSNEQKSSCSAPSGVATETLTATVLATVVVSVDPTATMVLPLDSVTPVPATATAVLPTATLVATSENIVLPTATLVPATTNSAPEPTASGQACPASTEAVASLVGGSANMWTPPDWSGGAWVFRSGGEFINLTVPNVPGSNTWIDYWNGSKGAADKLDSGQTLALNEASFHCHSK